MNEIFKSALAQANAMLEAVQDGREDALAVYIELKEFADALSSFLKTEGLQEALIEEVAKHGKEGASRAGYIATITGKTTYSYKHIPEWAELEAEKKRIEQLAKFAYNSNKSLGDADTGEQFTPARATYTEYVKLTKQRS